VLLRRPIAVLAVVLAAAAISAPAWGRAAATETSSNWSGYVVTAAKSFTTVSATSVVPRATCTAGQAASAAAWVGLGGDAEGSESLEQIGSELDCAASGTAAYSLWYELVPAASVPIRLAVAPGDHVAASVRVAGTRVTLRIANLTRGTRFAKTLTMAAPDTSSAEWIVEAPSACDARGFCRTVSLASFGKVAFANATATAGGHAGTISDAAWTATAVDLVSGGGQSFGPPGFGGPGFDDASSTSSAGAVPGALTANGAAFTVAWRQSVAAANAV
jgi:hypothetical protein